MRIEIMNGCSGCLATISGFQTNFNSLLSEKESIINGLNCLKSFSYSINGGLGILQSAANDIESKLQNEEGKRTVLQETQKKYNSFLELVARTDNAVADAVSHNQDEFYFVNEWAKPSVKAEIQFETKEHILDAINWLKKNLGKAADAFSHCWSVYNEYDFRGKSTKELENYYNELLSKYDSGNITHDDWIRLQALINYLGNTKINHDMSKKQKAKIKWFNTLYEKMHPEEKIESRDERYKYLIYNSTATKGFSLVAADAMKSGQVSCGDCQSMEDLTKDGGYGRQGDFNIYNFHSTKNADGSVSAEFSLSTVKKTTTEITVYDAEGNVYGERQYLVGQRDPSSIGGVIKETVNKTSDLLKGKFCGVDAEGYNSKNTYTVTIPPGGCIRITDDAGLIYADAISNANKEQGYTIGGILFDVAEGELINPIVGKVAYSTGKALEDTAVKDSIYGTNSNGESYGQAVIDSEFDVAIDTGVDLYEEIVGKSNPGVVGYKVIDGIVKANAALEGNVVRSQEDKTYGNGALIIYP